jgi:hypothetical protein
MLHKWKWVGHAADGDFCWCLVCGSLGKGGEPRLPLIVEVCEVPTMLTYHINMCAGGENPCAE